MTDHIGKLYSVRLQSAWKKGIRYALLIIRGLHFLPVFFLLFLYFGYKVFLDWLPATFPTYLLIAVILSGVLTRTQIRTLLKEPDPVFLMPAQNQLREYFRSSLQYSVIIQLLKTTVWMGFLFPLFFDRIGGIGAFFLSLVTLLFLKTWNVWIRWLEILSGITKELSLILRGVTNLLITAWLFYGALFGLPLVIALLWLGCITLYFRKRTPPSHIIPWDRLIALEQQTVSRYYRLANQFIDVPFIGNEIKPRPWLTFFYKWLPFRSTNTYLYLYLRTFFRYSEPFGVTIRLTLIATGLLCLFSFMPWYFTASIYFGALYLTAIQLPWIRRIHRYQPWFWLYPLPVKQQQTDLARLLTFVLGIQGTLILLPPLVLQSQPLGLLLILLILGWTGCYPFSHLYLSKTKGSPS